MSPILLSLHEVQGLPAFGIALYISRMTVAECGRYPMTRHAAGEQSLEGVPESSGYVLFIPDSGGQGHEMGHISNCLSDHMRCDYEDTAALPLRSYAQSIAAVFFRYNFSTLRVL